MQETYVSSTGWFDLQSATGRTRRRLPRALHEPDWDDTRPSSLCAAFGDQWVNPCSGGVIGQQAMAKVLNRSVRQVERKVFRTPLGASIRWVGDLAASNVKTLDIIREVLDTQARAAHLSALGFTDQSSGSVS